MTNKIILLTVLLFTFGCSDNKSINSSGSADESLTKNIPGIYHSENVNDDFVIYLNLPSGYNDTASEGFHVVYLLDADWYFYGSEQNEVNGTVGIISNLASEGKIPEIITVGIGYPAYNFRNRDFLSRGNDNFYNFLKNELIPTVDSLFNTKGSDGRTLIGHSYGGYFTMFSLFQYRPYEQLLFKNFIAISPIIMYRDYLLLNLDSLMAQEIDNRLPLALYMSAGTLEANKMQKGLDTMINLFNTRNYMDFDFNCVRYENLGHRTVVFPSIEDGMIWLFNH